MKDRVIRKLFGAAPLLYADWFIGPARAEDLTQYAVDTLVALGQPIYQNFFKGTANESWYFDQTNALESKLRTSIATWVNETLGPKTDAGDPLSTTGKGAKARYQQYIVSWIEAALSQIKNSAPSVIDDSVGSFAKVSAPPPSGPAPGWAQDWQWYEDAINDAVRQAQAALPNRADIDWSLAWDWAEGYINPATLAAHYKFDPIAPPKIVMNAVWTGLKRNYDWSPEELSAIKALLPTDGGRTPGGTAASFTAG